VWFQVRRKDRPSVYDRGTVYRCIKECSLCNGIYEIEKMGIFLPTWRRPFGLIKAIGGIVGSKSAIDYMMPLCEKELEIRSANVSWGKRLVVDEDYYELLPKNVIELDTDVGPGPVSVCDECGRREWQEKKLELPKIKGSVNSHIFRIKDTLIIVVDELFVENSAKVPDGSYLAFEEWFHQ